MEEAAAEKGTSARLNFKTTHYPGGAHLQVRQAFSLKYEPMCGRYRLSRRKEILAEYFDADFADMDWEPRYNIAPTQSVPVVRRGRPPVRAPGVAVEIARPDNPSELQGPVMSIHSAENS